MKEDPYWLASRRIHKLENQFAKLSDLAADIREFVDMELPPDVSAGFDCADETDTLLRQIGVAVGKLEVKIDAEYAARDLVAETAP